MTDGRIFQLNVSPGGVPKRAVASATLGALGLDGDAVEHPRIHGGPERAVCLYALELILALQEEGNPVFPGALGENVTLAGVPWEAIVPGARVALGPALVEVASYTTPCAVTARFTRGDTRCYHQAHRPGWSRVYARVLEGGLLAPGQPARILA